jgi:predicted lipoprotein with Yx(FWY)xxD motif
MRVLAAAAAAGALTLAACSSPPATHDSVGVGSSRLGAILVDHSGRTLYIFGSDKPGASVCVAACARVWPPALAVGAPTAGRSVSSTGLGTIGRADHSRQLTYYAHPLYTFSGDTGGGQLNGEGFLGTWFVVSPSGGKVVDPKAPAATPGY